MPFISPPTSCRRRLATSPLLPFLSFRSFFPLFLLAASSIVTMENVTKRSVEKQEKGFGMPPSPLSLSFLLLSHLHLGNAAIHNSSLVQFGRFSEYVIALSYTMSFTFPHRFCSLAPPLPYIFLFFSRSASRGATMPRPADVSSILHRVGAALTSITRR